MTDLAAEKISFLKALDALIDYHNLARARIAVLGKREKETMNWLQFLMRGLTNIPLIVAGIEQIHGDAISGAQKKQLAMEALGLGSTVAAGIAPEQQPVIQAATSLASQTIDGVVSVMNAAKTNPTVSVPSTTASAAPTASNAGQTPASPTLAVVPSPTPQNQPPAQPATQPASNQAQPTNVWP